jgi:hypothetical protein
MITQAPALNGRYDLKSFRAGFHRVYAVADSNCSVFDISACSDIESDHHHHQQQQQQQQPLVIDVGSSIGYFPFLFLSLGAVVYLPPQTPFREHYNPRIIILLLQTTL